MNSDNNEINEITETDEIILPEKPDFSEEILSIIKSGKSNKEISELLSDYHENDIAATLELMSPEERKKLYRILGNELMSEVFTYLDDVSEYIEELDSEKAADVIEAMDADDAVDALEDLDEEKREELLNLIDSEAKEDIKLIDSYEDYEIGSKMTTNFIVINKSSNVKAAMKSVIKQAADNDNIMTVYVINDDETFYGAIDLKDLIIARDFTDFETLITTSYPYVYANETVEECLEQLKDYSEDSIPVLSTENKILGVITSQDIIEVVDEEMGEDYAKLGGLTAEEDLNEPILMSIKKRIPWLIVLFALAIGISTVIGLFENTIAAIPLIICFQTLILDMAGNVGTQSLAVTIRVLVDEDLTFKERFKLVFKEMRVGLCNGLILGSGTFLLVGLYLKFLKAQTYLFSFSCSACVAVALCLAMVISSFTGTIIPIIFKKLKVDPAVASGPLITTINDLVAVVVYYGLAILLLIPIIS